MRKLRRRIRRILVGLPTPVAAALAAVLIAPAPGLAWTPTDPTIAPGVSVGSVNVGGMDRAAATAAVTAAWTAPITIGVGEAKLRTTAAGLGQQLALTDALDRAWAVGRAGTPAPASASIPLTVTVKRTVLLKWIDAASATFNRAPRNAATRLRGRSVRVVKHVYGRALRRDALSKALVTALTSPNAGHALGMRPDLVRNIKPATTSTELAPVLVIDRSDRTLTLWSPHRKGQTFRIAVGQPSYPTPLGHWNVVTKQVNPTWTPPNSDWAQGAKPIAPGPDNPLGTRWIGLSASGVGIHGTPNEGSVGTAASHGCIRMRRREVERLFRRVRVGSPVHIIA